MICFAIYLQRATFHRVFSAKVRGLVRLSGEAVHAARLVSGKRSNAAGFTEICEEKSMKI